MTLQEQINSDTVNAMKNQDKFALSVLRMLKSALQLESINKKHDLTDDEIVMVIKKQVKTRKDSVDEYLSYNKQELVEGLQKEIDILSKYLPQEMSVEEIEKELDALFDEYKTESIKDMGPITKAFSAKFGTCADMKTVSSMIKERLTNC